MKMWQIISRAALVAGFSLTMGGWTGAWGQGSSTGERDATPFPQPPNIKGLQVQMVDDAIQLGIHHAALNVSLGLLLALPPADGAAESAEDAAKVEVFHHAGKPYRVRREYVQHLDAQIRPLSEAGIVVYLILLAYPTGDAAKDAVLLHPAGREMKGYTIAAFNTETPEGRAHYAALVAYLAQRYSSNAAPTAGRVWGYIIGNEVNSQWMWYAMGKQPVQQAAQQYQQAVRLAYESIHTYSEQARVYLSFDHHWSVSMPGISAQEAYGSKAYLTHFAQAARAAGDFPWHVAYHPYPDDLGNPRTWDDKQAWPTEDAPHVTFKNLEVLCRFLEQPEMLWQGKARRVILSEQGIHCLATPDGPDLQAAGFVYAWEKATRQPGIDAMIWHRHVDHAHEGGLRLGLWSNQPGSVADPHQKRRIYDLFLKAGSPEQEWHEAAAFALPYFGIKDWSQMK